MKYRSMIGALCMAAVMLAGCAPTGAGNTDGTGGGNTQQPPYPQTLARADVAEMEYSPEDYAERIVQPFWYGNVQYNEPAIAWQEEGGTYADLLYAPERVVSVRDRTLETEYEEGKDYVVDKANKRLVIPEGSAIPTLSPNAEWGEDLPEGYEETAGVTSGKLYQIWQSGGKGKFVFTEGDLFWGRYLSVTYAYSPEELRGGGFHVFDGALPATREKLKSGKGIKLGIVGDSISAGNSSTALLGVAPHTAAYPQLVKTELETVYGCEVGLVNIARGGTQSDWVLKDEGAAALKSLQSEKPDLVVIAYGMNDGTPGVTHDAETLAENVSRIMSSIKVWSPGCEFIVVNSFPPNELYARRPEIFEEYAMALEGLEEGDGSVIALDLYEIGKTFLTRKRYSEIASNNANHPNDFLHRVYAMNILSALVEY